jgi:hypothetical protein
VRRAGIKSSLAENFFLIKKKLFVFFLFFSLYFFQINIISKMERTYVMVKPDGVQRGLVGEILKRFEQRGYQLLALELIHPTKERLEEHVSFTK